MQLTKEGRIMYQVIDSQTQQIRGTYQSRRRAARRADALDLEYGAIRYRVEPLMVCSACGVDHPYNQGACIEVH